MNFYNHNLYDRKLIGLLIVNIVVSLILGLLLNGLPFLAGQHWLTITAVVFVAITAAAAALVIANSIEFGRPPTRLGCLLIAAAVVIFIFLGLVLIVDYFKGLPKPSPVPQTTATATAAPIPSKRPTPAGTPRLESECQAEFISFEEPSGAFTLCIPPDFNPELLSSHNGVYAYHFSTADGQSGLRLSFSRSKEEPFTTGRRQKFAEEKAAALRTEFNREGYGPNARLLKQDITAAAGHILYLEMISGDDQYHALWRVEERQGLIALMFWITPQTRWTGQEAAINRSLQRFRWSPESVAKRLR